MQACIPSFFMQSQSAYLAYAGEGATSEEALLPSPEHSVCALLILCQSSLAFLYFICYNIANLCGRAMIVAVR